MVCRTRNARDENKKIRLDETSALGGGPQESHAFLTLPSSAPVFVPGRATDRPAFSSLLFLPPSIRPADRPLSACQDSIHQAASCGTVPINALTIFTLLINYLPFRGTRQLKGQFPVLPFSSRSNHPVGNSPQLTQMHASLPDSIASFHSFRIVQS